MRSPFQRRIGVRRARAAGNRAGPFITCRWKRTSSTPALTRNAIDDVAIDSVRVPHGDRFVASEVRLDECSSVPSAISIGDTGSKFSGVFMGVEFSSLCHFDL